jgi:hypothetical protein
MLLMSLMVLPGVSQAKGAPDQELSVKIRFLLNHYAQKDVAGMMSLLSDGNVLIIGSDLSEVCTTKEQAEKLFRSDFKLWDSSSFGLIGKVYTQQAGDMITAFFDVPFTFLRGQNSQTVVVRFATVWKKSPQGLRLVQSMNTTPTIHQSAEELSSGGLKSSANKSNE